MQLPEAFRRQVKQKRTAYSAVEVEADSLDTEIGVTNQATPPPGWPEGPQRIATAPSWVVADCLLLLFPIAFIVLAALACQLDGKEVSSYGKRIQDAILLGPTIYPLVFAALGGRALRKIAIWRASEGTTLGFLEHMIGSQSLVSTVGHAITIHSLDVLTVALLALWALSPLGGQSVLRLLIETNSTVTENRTVFYSSVESWNIFGDTSRVYAVVSTALMTAPILEWTPKDAWDHVKVPRIAELEIAESQNTTERPWFIVNPKGNYSYASLAGVNVINLSEGGATNLTIPYEYMYFDCKPSPSNHMTEFSERSLYESTIIQYLQDLNKEDKLITDRFRENETFYNSSLGRKNFFMYTKHTQDNLEALLYGSLSQFRHLFLWECSMKNIMVETNIVCQSEHCTVKRLRRMDTSDKTRKSLYSYGASYHIIHNRQWNRYFIEELASLGEVSSTWSSNPIDAYINGSTDPWVTIRYGGVGPTPNWTEYTGAPQKAIEMSHRLTKVLNTFFDSSRWPLAITRSDPFARRSLNETSGEPTYGLTMNSTEAVVSLLIPVYRGNTPWAACLVTCSSVLLCLSMFGIFVSTETAAPDIFNHVSSLTRDNPYLNAPAGGSGLDGADRARLLRRTRVQLGDVDASSKTGYVAFRSVNTDEDCRMGRIRSERLYR